MDVTIIEAPGFTKNKSCQRDPKVFQTKKDNGLKVHIGADARTRLTHSFTTTAPSEYYLNQAGNLLQGEEKYVFADSGYRVAEEWKGLDGIYADWQVAEISSTVMALK